MNMTGFQGKLVLINVQIRVARLASKKTRRPAKLEFHINNSYSSHGSTSCAVFEMDSHQDHKFPVYSGFTGMLCLFVSLVIFEMGSH